MSAAAATMFCLSGAAVVASLGPRIWLADTLAAATGAIAAIALAAYLTIGRDPFSAPSASGGHAAISTALMFLLIAIAGGTPGRRSPFIRTTLAVATLVLSMTGVLSSAYGVSDVSAAQIMRTGAMPGQIGLAMLAAALLLLRPEQALAAALFAASKADRAARQQLALLAAVPFAGSLLVGQISAGRMSAALAMVMLVVFATAPLGWLILSSARARGRAEAAQGERGLLASIVDSSDDAIVTKSLRGVVTSWNAGAEQVFGYTAQEMIGQTLERIFPPDLFSEETDILARISRGERIQHYETTRLRKGGARIEVSVSISPVRDAAGQIIGAAKIARDITEQQRVRARLEEVQSELFHVARLSDMSQMATGLAHELNQPLSAISNYISGAQKLIETGDLDRARQGCEKAAGQVVRAGEVIRRLRDFVDKTPGQMRLERLADVIEESGALAFLGAKGAGVSVELRLAGDVPEALMDKVQIQQVIVNLVRNAAEAMADSDERRLTVSAHRSGPKEVEVAVADTGHGLPDEVRQKLFQPFTTTKPTGMGVGLSLCRTIIDAHGGRIWAENRPEGGAIFRFTLPAGAD